MGIRNVPVSQMSTQTLRDSTGETEAQCLDLWWVELSGEVDKCVGCGMTAPLGPDCLGYISICLKKGASEICLEMDAGGYLGADLSQPLDGD